MNFVIGNAPVYELSLYKICYYYIMWRRNADTSLRELIRRASSGDLDAVNPLWRQRLRSGELGPIRVDDLELLSLWGDYQTRSYLHNSGFGGLHTLRGYTPEVENPNEVNQPQSWANYMSMMLERYYAVLTSYCISLVSLKKLEHLFNTELVDIELPDFDIQRCLSLLKEWLSVEGLVTDGPWGRSRLMATTVGKAARGNICDALDALVSPYRTRRDRGDRFAIQVASPVVEQIWALQKAGIAHEWTHGVILPFYNVLFNTIQAACCDGVTRHYPTGNWIRQGGDFHGIGQVEIECYAHNALSAYYAAIGAWTAGIISEEEQDYFDEQVKLLLKQQILLRNY